MPSKRKKQPSPRRKKVASRSDSILLPPREVPAVAPAPAASYASSGWTLLLLAAVIALLLVCSASHYPQAAKVFLVIALFVGASYFLNLNNLKNVLFLIGIGWVLTAFAMGTNPNFAHVFSFWPGFHLPNPLMTFAVGLGLMIGFWRFLPPASPSQDISKGWARLWFWLIFAVAVFFRMYKVHEAVGCYWDDLAVAITDPRDIQEFHARPLLMPIANREPFYPYFFAALWSFMPDAYAVFVQRLGSGLIDLASVWLFYLVGKEAGGRRVGLVAAALAAVSKPMLIAELTGASNVTAPMAVALAMLTTFRLFKNPNWKHFIYWGLALGFLPYNYTSVRPWLLFIVTAVFLWIWFYKQKDQRTRSDSPLGWGTLGAWTFTFLLIHHFLPTQSPWVAFLNHTWVGIAVLAFLLFLFFQSLREPNPSLVPRFFLGVFLGALAMYPLARNPLIAVHAAGFSIFHTHNDLVVHFGWDSLKVLFAKIAETLSTVFVSGEDRGDMNLAGDAFFDYHFIMFFVLGWVSVLVKPDWTKLFLLAGGLVGIAPHILGMDGHSGRLVCCLVPLAVLAGLGVEQLNQAAKSAFPKSYRFWAVPLLAAYFGWASWGSFERVWNNFFVGERVEKTVSNQVKQFSVQDRVFLAPYPLFVSEVTQALLDQGYDVYSLKASNPIYLKPGENPKKAVVLYHYYDKDTDAKIMGKYKSAVKELINLGGWPDKRGACWRAIVPASDITDKPGELFYFQRVPASNWTRDYLMGRFILGYGVIEIEESVANLNNPIYPGAGGRLINLRGHFTLTAGGRVTFKVRTNDYVKFQVDGRKLLYLSPDWTPQPASKTVDLAAGDHQVEYDIWLQHEQTIPQIWMSVNGGPDVLLGLPANTP